MVGVFLLGISFLLLYSAHGDFKKAVLDFAGVMVVSVIVIALIALVVYLLSAF